jgi:Tfp pilus assembly protein PilE
MKKRFTLIELLVIVAIVVILVSIVANGIKAFSDGSLKRDSAPANIEVPNK